MKKLIFSIVLLLIFCLGAIGGVWAQAFLLPYMATHSPYKDWTFIEEWRDRMFVIQSEERIVIGEREGLERVANDANRVVVGVQSTNGRIVLQGGGFIATADGWVVTLAELVPQGYSVEVYREGDFPVSARVLKRDLQANLALLQIERGNLPTVGFAQEDMAIGRAVFALTKIIEIGQEDPENDIQIRPAVHEGIIHSLTEEEIQTTIEEGTMFRGSPVLDLQGRIVGVSDIDEEGMVIAIPSASLRTFLEERPAQ